MDFGTFRMRLSRKNKRLKYHMLNCQYSVMTRLASDYYDQLTEERLRDTRKSDIIFIFGSGYSLNDISTYEWEYIKTHNTMGFNYFFHQNFVNVDYHLIKEGSRNDLSKKIARRDNEYYADHINNNPRYDRTVFIIQKGLNGNRLLGQKLLKKNSRIFRYNTTSRNIYQPPSSSFDEGLVHGPSSLIDCVNFAAIMNWEKIVLAGVDLYDRRYFWLSEDETRDTDINRYKSYNNPHQTSERTISCLGKWKDLFNQKGIELYVYNPRSLLASVLPVFKINV